MRETGRLRWSHDRGLLQISVLEAPLDMALNERKNSSNTVCVCFMCVCVCVCACACVESSTRITKTSHTLSTIHFYYLT